MNSTNNEVCEFDSTPTTENFSGQIIENFESCGYDDNCTSKCKKWSWSDFGMKCT